MSDQSYTPEEFCEAERISRGMLYKLWARGEGPAFYRVGNRPRITHEARLAWQRKHAAKYGKPSRKVANARLGV
jgi:hypothetical protein